MAKTYSGRATEKERLYIEAAHALIVDRDFKKQFDILSEIEEKYPKEKQVHELLAQHYYLKGRTDDEINEYEQLLELDPGDARTYNALAYLYVLQKDDFDRGMEYLDRYESLLPEDANPLDSRAELYIRVGRLDEAISICKGIMEIKPDFPYLGVKIGYCYALKEDYAEALRWLDYHITVSGSKVWKGGGYMTRGFIDYMIGAEDQALADFQTAIGLTGDVDNILWNRYTTWSKGWVHYERGEFEAARHCFSPPLDSLEEFLLSIPQRPPIMDYRYSCTFALGLLEVKEGDIDAARARLAGLESLASDIHPQYADLTKIFRDMLRAEIFLAGDEYDKAIGILEQSPRWEIPRFSPSFVVPYSAPYLKDVLARAYTRRGEYEKAIAVYEWLTTIGPERELCPLIHPLYHYRLALLYEQTGRGRLAAERYQRFLDTWIHADPDREEIVDARTRLERLRGESAD
jgi:tetratricopeptide (TPR) repeat protein